MTSLWPRKRVLIVKTGHGETLDPENGGVISLGDILRSTVLLNLFPAAEYATTWVVSGAGAPLLANNPFISHLVVVDSLDLTELRLPYREYEIVVNLEKDPRMCRALDAVPAEIRYGYGLSGDGSVVMSSDAPEVQAMIHDPSFKKHQGRSWSELLYRILGRDYDGAPYVVQAPSRPPRWDVGLNHLVGSKFPLKAWPKGHWEQLAEGLSEHASVCWQQSANDLNGYIDWISSCRVIVTNDSLGLHLAMALGRGVVAMFGPTVATEVDQMPHMVKLLPEVDWDCVPCLSDTCTHEHTCMAHVSPRRVQQAVLDVLASLPVAAGRPLEVGAVR